jgi:coenzyme PQQ biosynthesis protein PqqD
VRLVHNEAQGGWILLAPERVFKADAIAAEIIKGCTGEVAFAELVDELAKSYAAPREEILADSRDSSARRGRQKARGVVIEATTKPLDRWPCGRAGFRNAA